MSYATMDHAGWVASNILPYHKRKQNQPKMPTELTAFMTRVIDICGMVGGGIYNAPINWDKVDFGVGAKPGWGRMFVPWRDGRLATFDGHQLTLLVLLCHETRIRCEVQARAWGHLLLSFHERSHEGGTAVRHPDIDEAVAAFRRYLPTDHRAIYRAPAAQDEAA